MNFSQQLITATSRIMFLGLVAGLGVIEEPSAFAQRNPYADILDVVPTTPSPAPTPEPRICIASQGEPDRVPEHTLDAYRMAMEAGADFLDLKLQMTSDGHLICLADATLQRTTDVAIVYPDRYLVTDPTDQLRKTWRAVDFSLLEIKKLNAGAHYKGLHEGAQIPTLQEVLILVNALGQGSVGLLIEIKDTQLYDIRGYRIVEALLDLLSKSGMNTPEALIKVPIYIMAAHPKDLHDVRKLAWGMYPLVQRIDHTQAPGMLTEVGLIRISDYAQVIAPDLELLINRPERVGFAHEQGLAVFAASLSWERLPEGYKDLSEYTDFVLYEIGVDGVFTEDPRSFPHVEIMADPDTTEQ